MHILGAPSEWGLLIKTKRSIYFLNKIVYFLVWIYLFEIYTQFSINDLLIVAEYEIITNVHQADDL